MRCCRRAFLALAKGGGCLYTVPMKKTGLVLLLLVFSLSGCVGDAAPVRRTVFAMDTVMNLSVYGADADHALAAAEAELHRLDTLLARGTADSAVYAYNHGETPVDAELAELIAQADTIAAATGGAFDPYLGAALDLWGFGSGAGERRVPASSELATAPLLLDLGGIAKGLAGERVRALLCAYRVSGAVLDLGGDVAVLGDKPDGSLWRVALRDPANKSDYLGTLETEGDVYIATSGVYERYFEENGVRYHHILDPKTRRPAESDLVSATVVCESGVWADALATACCVLGTDGALALRERLAGDVDFDLILVTDDSLVWYTTDFEPKQGSPYRYEHIS